MLRLVERLTQPFPHADAEQPPQGLLRFCWYYVRGFRLPVVFLTFTSAIQAILEVMLFAFLGKIVDWLSGHDRATFLHDEASTLWMMGAVVLVALPLMTLSNALMRHQALMGNFPMAVRWRMHRHLLDQSLGFYQDEFAGRVATKVMQTALATRELVLKTTNLFVYMSVYFVSMVVLLGQINLWLMLPIVVWFVLYVAMQMYFVPRLKAVSQRQADARSTMTGRIVDAYTNIATVKLFAHTNREAGYARDSMQGFLHTVYKQFRLVTGLDFCINTLNYVLIFAVSALGIILWLNEIMSAGALAVAVAMALRVNSMSHWVLWEISGLFENLGTVTDGMSMLALPKYVQDAPDARPLEVSAGAVAFDDVRFHYHNHRGDDERAPIVFDGLNLSIAAGEKIGLVGRSGAGKSTLVNLLLRFYDLQGGRITIDGQDIAKVRQDSLRHHIAMVTQDTSLLHRSVRENILYGKPDADEAALAKAIKGAQADEFIAELNDPDGNIGLDAQVGERGVKLSGGQRQRIAIARVLLKDAPILLLDEATSALDSEVEAAIQSSLNRLMDGKTVIAIAHRLSTIAAMDRLVVMDKGAIVEMGSHDELLAHGGIYARLWARQTGGYLGHEEG
ncbi:ABC transporter ATP-binding protein/permease [Suttonella sp. R2A3]|uniref:ABC transporter ATP-binding protein n=1 Tax=Suttonella sp. R2A3 TaxID=2908648 RepID=UPI001F2CC87F|nr:ABC transporter ATP-binding protein [Suttonella sp. R2A3]UJF25288.1 ABC transporter ATP-binding protein/permease [Suttonella sp. R2A3]